MSLVDQKQQQIVEAALKRFSHFGIAKTTMTEIADDLLISKASLYYYFPDKTALVLLVAESILSDLIEEQEAVLEKSKEFEKGLQDLSVARICFGRKYFMMHIGDGQSDINTSDPRFKLLLEGLKQKELEFVSKYIERFAANGVLKELEVTETAQVFIDVLIGIWVAEIHVHHKSMLPSDQLFEDIKMKTQRIISIFCDGIKKC